MPDYIPPTLDWVREQVELYELSGGTEGTTLRATGLPCIIVTHIGNKTGAIRKIALMRVREVADNPERQRLWDAGVVAYPTYEDYRKKAPRKIPVFLAEPVRSGPASVERLAIEWWYGWFGLYSHLRHLMPYGTQLNQ